MPRALPTEPRAPPAEPRTLADGTQLAPFQMKRLEERDAQAEQVGIAPIAGAARRDAKDVDDPGRT
ncbi:MAG TPA: hypothetical protein VGS17_07550, partial [Candidatus Limnocylindria bacterium]|nr:hypothetical protein [Candidatus Limnocylindria bacterium]